VYGHMQGIKTYLLDLENIMGNFFVADLISGHFMKIWILVIFSIFFHLFQQMLIVGSPNWGMGVLRPKTGVILNVWVQFNLYLNHFEQLEANISSKRLCRFCSDLSPNCKNRGDPLNIWVLLYKIIFNIFQNIGKILVSVLYKRKKKEK
jgi:hypothetical protein